MNHLLCIVFILFSMIMKVCFCCAHFYRYIINVRRHDVFETRFDLRNHDIKYSTDNHVDLEEEKKKKMREKVHEFFMKFAIGKAIKVARFFFFQFPFGERKLYFCLWLYILVIYSFCLIISSVYIFKGIRERITFDAFITSIYCSILQFSRVRSILQRNT